MGLLDSLLSISQQVVGAASPSNMVYNKSLELWEREWRHVGMLTDKFSAYAKYVGVYRAELQGQLVYIGRAIEWDNGGFRKRMSDYTRNSDSSRTHSSGQKMHEHASDLVISIIITGEDAEAARIATAIEVALIGKYQPPWNVMSTER